MHALPMVPRGIFTVRLKYITFTIFGNHLWLIDLMILAGTN